METNIDTTEYSKNYYHKPSLNIRVKAVVVDAVIVLTLMYLISLLLNLFEVQSGMVRAGCLGLILLYEPLLVSIIGGTFGQKAMGLRVFDFHELIKRNTKKNINIPFSLLRFASKFLFGWFSLMTIHANTYGQALHDMLGASIVSFNK